MIATKCIPTQETINEAKCLLALPEYEAYAYWLSKIADYRIVQYSSERGKKLAFRNWQRYLKEIVEA
jgi:hypothetical protein